MMFKAGGTWLKLVTGSQAAKGAGTTANPVTDLGQEAKGAGTRKTEPSPGGEEQKVIVRTRKLGTIIQVPPCC